MTVKAFPFSGTSPNDAGPYSADEWALIWQALTSTYERRTTGGVMLQTGSGTKEALLVEQTSPTSLGVVVRRGWCMVNGYAVYNDGDTTLSIDQNTDPTDDRIDTIAMEVDYANSDGELVVIKGTAAAVPVAPSLTQDQGGIWQIRIADITVVALDTEIVDGDIDNSVREYMTLVATKEGGTALSSYSQGDMLVASATNTLAQHNVPDYMTAVRDVGATNEFGLATPVLAAAYYDEPFGTNGAALSAGAWNTLPFDNLDDPAGIFSSLSGGVFTIENTGIYQLVFVETAIYRNVAGGVQFQLRLRNTTTSTTEAQGPADSVPATTAILIGQQNWFQSVIFSAAAGDTIAIQGWATAALLWGLAQSTVVDSANQPEIFAHCIFKRIQ